MTSYGPSIGTVTLKSGIDRYETYRVYEVDGSYYYYLGDAAGTADGFVGLAAEHHSKIERSICA